MYFGMTNAPGAFLVLMNEIFRDMIINMLIVIYLDNILTEQQEPDRTTREVLRRLRLDDLSLKPEKYECNKLKTEFLGLIVSEGQIEMGPVKLSGVTNWPTPKKEPKVWNTEGLLLYKGRIYNTSLTVQN